MYNLIKKIFANTAFIIGLGYALQYQMDQISAEMAPIVTPSKLVTEMYNGLMAGEFTVIAIGIVIAFVIVLNLINYLIEGK